MAGERSPVSASSLLWRYLRFRALELVVWLGIPLVSVFAPGEWPRLSDLILFGLATSLLMGGVLLFNDWGDTLRNPAELGRVSIDPGAASMTDTRPLLWVSTLLLLASILLFFLLSREQALLGALGAALAVGYSHPRLRIKERVLAASLLHLLFGLTKCALGYLVCSSDWGGAMILGLFFALVFAAGHLVHTCIDVEEDRSAGIETAATRYGTQAVMSAATATFLVAHAHVVLLGALGVITWPMAAALSLPMASHARRAGAWLADKRDTAAQALAYRRSYRALFAVAVVLFVLASLWRL